MLHFIRRHETGFHEAGETGVSISWLLIIVGIGYGIHRGKDAVRRRFLGGDTMTFTPLNREFRMDKIRSALTSAGVKDAAHSISKGSVAAAAKRSASIRQPGTAGQSQEHA